MGFPRKDIAPFDHLASKYTPVKKLRLFGVLQNLCQVDERHSETIWAKFNLYMVLALMQQFSSLLG